jgi:hypothetical protein
MWCTATQQSYRLHKSSADSRKEHVQHEINVTHKRLSTAPLRKQSSQKTTSNPKADMDVDVGAQDFRLQRL